MPRLLRSQATTIPTLGKLCPHYPGDQTLFGTCEKFAEGLGESFLHSLSDTVAAYKVAV